MKKPVEMIDGFSKSAWKSLAVKALRIGWPAGLVRAQAALGKSDMKLVLTCGVFEDIFPAVAEIQETMTEIRELKYPALCRRQTHHGRPGITDEFCRLEPRAVAAAKTEMSRLWEAARPYRIWLPLRSLNCWWTWLEIAPHDSDKTRTVDNSPWTGMPTCMLDDHTLEGRRAGTGATLLSGHYDQHLVIARLVQAEIEAGGEGWTAIRAEVHGYNAPLEGEMNLELFSDNDQ